MILAGWVDFACWWSCIGKGLRLTWLLCLVPAPVVKAAHVQKQAHKAARLLAQELLGSLSDMEGL